MKRWTTAAAFLAIVVATLTVTAVASQDAIRDERDLRAKIEARYDVVPLSSGLALTPKSRNRDLRLIEVSNGVVAVNGVPVTGRELRERVGEDADAILRLSYLPLEQRRELFGGPGAKAAPRSQPDEPRQAEQPAEGAAARRRHSGGERVRIFGDVHVAENESIGGDVVAVLGSVRVDGEVTGQVVSVLGSVHAGPKAIIRSDVVSVGGRVRRAPGSQLLADVTEVSIGEAVGRAGVDVDDWPRGAMFRGDFGAFPKLMGSTFRLVLMAVLGGLMLLVARRAVEGSAQRVVDSPGKAIVVGLLAEVFFAPVLALIVVLLAISIIGIPLIVLLPFAIIFLIIMALVGFTGTSFAVGQAAQRRFGIGGTTSFLAVCLGLVIIVSPLLAGRVVAFAQWPDNPLAWLLVGVGTFVEFLAWTGGFGAVLMNTYAAWRARRVARSAVPPVPPPAPA
jgi:hypothetical protein